MPFAFRLPNQVHCRYSEHKLKADMLFGQLSGNGGWATLSGHADWSTLAADTACGIRCNPNTKRTYCQLLDPINTCWANKSIPAEWKAASVGVVRLCTCLGPLTVPWVWAAGASSVIRATSSLAGAAQLLECTPEEAAKLVEGTGLWQRLPWDRKLFKALSRRECPGLWPLSCLGAGVNQGLAADAA